MNRKELLAFSISGYDSTCHGLSFFDVRVRLSIGGSLKNLNLLSVTFFKRHTAKNIVELLCVILKSIATDWREKLLTFFYGRH